MQPEDYRVDKTRYSAFTGTNLDKVLQREQVERVELVGVCTSICIMETVKELFDRDLPALVYRDGVADFDPEAHAFALKHMAKILWGRGHVFALNIWPNIWGGPGVQPCGRRLPCGQRVLVGRAHQGQPGGAP